MGFKKSDSIAELITALVKAQAEIENPKKNRLNPHFKSSYADLDAVIESAKKPLAKHGLVLLQAAQAQGNQVMIITLLAHTSGQWIENDLTMVARDSSPQAIGATISYGRRYEELAILNLAAEDDDAQSAQPGQPVPQQRNVDPRPQSASQARQSDSFQPTPGRATPAARFNADGSRA